AVDYVMKPLDAARLADAVGRLKARVDSTPAKLESLLQVLAERLGGGRGFARWITASQGDGGGLITLEGICDLRADKKCTMVVTADRESLIYRSIKELAEVLDPDTFWQIHRGTIINIKHISAISRDYRGRLRVKMKDRPEILKVSAPHAHLFRQL